MLKNQKGFSVGHVLLIILVIGLVSGVGYYVYQEQNQTQISNFEECKAAGNPIMESYPEQCNANGRTFTKDIDTSEPAVITNLADKAVYLRQPQDVDKLPSTTPASFKAYAKEELADNKPDNNECVEIWVIEKVSELNISGSKGAAFADGTSSDKCIGGAPAFWYAAGQTWQVYSSQVRETCAVIERTNVYAEFIPDCYKSADDMDTVQQNPNGSITDALKN